MRAILTVSTIMLASLLPSVSFAGAGSQICAISEVYECLALEGCKRVPLKLVNLSAFMTLDVDKKTLTSATPGEAERSEDVEGLTVTDKAIYLHGTQDEETWNATIELKNGAFTGGITSGTSSFALFGTCTPKS